MDPLKQMDRCHRRLEERLGALVDAVEGLGERDDAWETIEDVMDYLGRSIVRHERDEEESLFPRLRGATDVEALLTDLERQHGEQREAIGALQTAVDEARGTATESLRAAAKRVHASYTAHIAREDAELLPAARRHLRADDLAAMAEEMQARRPGKGKRR